jgi:hypothetical protein
VGGGNSVRLTSAAAVAVCLVASGVATVGFVEVARAWLG